MHTRPYGADPRSLERAARIVLDMELLGVATEDLNAPELDALSTADREVVERARVWALARREEAHRRSAAAARREAVSAPASSNGSSPTAQPTAPATVSGRSSNAPPRMAAMAPSAPSLATSESTSESTASANGLASVKPSVLDDQQPAPVDEPRRMNAEIVSRVVMALWVVAAIGVLLVLASLVIG